MAKLTTCRGRGFWKVSIKPSDQNPNHQTTMASAQPFTPTPPELEAAYADAHRREQQAYNHTVFLRNKRFNNLLTRHDQMDKAVAQDDQMARWIAEGVIRMPGGMEESRKKRMTVGLPDPKRMELMFGNQKDLDRQDKILRRLIAEAHEVWEKARADLRAARAARGY